MNRILRSHGEATDLMSSTLDGNRQPYLEQLSNFEKRLRSTADDEELLKGVHATIVSLLTGSLHGEADIRDVLRRQLQAGQMREETFQLVSGMLDNIVHEELATLNDEPIRASGGDDENRSFDATTVITPEMINKIPAEDRLQIGSVLRDRFLLQEKVAGGSMGVVYKAMDRRLAEVDAAHSTVAVKVMSPQLSKNAHALRALQQEAAKGRCLSHPNIVRFVDLDRDEDMYFIVMEWLEGKSLASVLDEDTNQKLEVNRALAIVRQIGHALEYAHQRGVVHADVKPANIMALPSGDVKLFDFGIARIRQKQHDGEPEFDPGVLGAVTPAYSSMQVLTGEDPVPADDVFSLGCLTYRLIAGYRVFGPRNAAEAAEAGMEPQRPPGLTDNQWFALRKSLAYSRVARFPSPEAFLIALDDIRVDRKESDFEEIILPDEDESQSRTPWRKITMLVMLFAAVAVITQTDLVNRFNDGTLNFPWSKPAADRPVQVNAPGQPIDDAAVTNGESEDFQSGDELPTAADDGSIAGSDELTGTSEPAAQDQPDSAQLPDFSRLPSPDVIVPLGGSGRSGGETELTLVEDGAPLVIDLTRESGLRLPMTVELEEMGFSGNRSPWETGQYEISNGGRVEFAAGQSRARTTITMSSDPLREPDRQVRLHVRNLDDASSELAIIRLSLEDDDQRAFESGLAPNTVAFAVSQVSVRERDPAVQIDVLRFNPDASFLEVDYTIRDVTAAQGEDYFVPGVTSIEFAPGQRTARLLIPLVQDTVPETDEAFMLELEFDEATSDANIFRRIAVMIRDDDSN